jgi:ppGpp synthetase/RelA/SpoT-type nucleotidyltranferase
MNEKKPSSIAEYREWLSKQRNCDLPRARSHYESVTIKIKADLEASQFWKDLIAELKEYDAQYSVSTGFPLQMRDQPKELLIKPFDSFLLKTYRKNVLLNRKWPTEPADGWILPNNWFGKINDIARTLIAVKYLDGVQFLVDKLKSFSLARAVDCQDVLEARTDGYYAAHVYTKHTCEIPGMTWDTGQIVVSCEIQITTQLQETIRRLLHKYYEQKRERPPKDSFDWQWNYKSDEFGANYLGHILHYVEGMIMEIREKQKKGNL